MVPVLAATVAAAAAALLAAPASRVLVYSVSSCCRFDCICLLQHSHTSRMAPAAACADPGVPSAASNMFSNLHKHNHHQQ